jgi:hypothetical protein
VRAVFRRARAVAVADVTRRGLLRSRPGRWSEKLLTLTAPHFAHHSIAERIGIVVRAWARFLRLLNASWRARHVRSAEWYRVFEWTPGVSDDRGHPHLHIWLLSPYLLPDEIKSWWRQALAEQVRDATVVRVIVDIREVHADGAEHELIKYLTKDITANGEKVAPELYAEVYKALDGHRSTQSSRGFTAKAEVEKRVCECGCAFPPRVRKQRAEPKPALEKKA